jgi:hypothetical protein
LSQHAVDEFSFDYRPGENLVAVSAASTTTAMSASATALAAISTTTASATARSALDLGTGFVHIEGASADLGTIECRDGLVTFFSVTHLHEAEAARAAGVPVGHNADAVHLSMGLEKFAQLVFPGIEVQVTDKNIFHGIASC